MTKTYAMQRGRILRIDDGAGSVVRVHSGGLWLTQATRPSSISLSANES